MTDTEKRRRDMTEIEKAYDWQNRLSPRWWRAIVILFVIAGVLFLLGALLRGGFQ